MNLEFRSYVNRNRDVQYITEAIKIAESAKTTGDDPIGSVLVFHGNVLSECNTVIREGSLLNHAEINVIKKATDLGFHKLKDAILYSSVEPSPMCALIALEHGITEIVFGAYSAHGFVSSKILNLDMLPIVQRGGILAKECRDILPIRLQEQTRESI